MTEINMIHKSDVYFDVMVPIVQKSLPMEHTSYQMRHGDIYIYSNKIYLRDENNFYRANIREIKEIKTDIPRKQILIRFWNFDVVISCKEYAHLLALRDFLNLAQSYFRSKNIILLNSKTMRRTRVN